MNYNYSMNFIAFSYHCNMILLNNREIICSNKKEQQNKNNNKNNRGDCEICSQLVIKIPEQC